DAHIRAATFRRQAELSREDRAELLHEARHTGRAARVHEIECPVQLHTPRPWPRLAADDQPIDAGKVELVDGPEQRLGAHEADRRRRTAKGISAGSPAVVLD